MTAPDFGSVLEKLNTSSRGEVCLTMPKFRIHYDFDKVVEHLRELGVNKIFVPDEGDFGNLFSKVKNNR